MYILLYSMVKYCFVSCIQYILPLKHRASMSKQKGEWSCYRNRQFNGGRMVMSRRRPV